MFMFLILRIRSPEFLMPTGIMLPKNGVRASVIALASLQGTLLMLWLRLICVLWLNRIVLVLKCSIPLVLKCSISLVLSRNVFTFFNSSAVLLNVYIYRPFVGLSYVLSFQNGFNFFLFHFLLPMISIPSLLSEGIIIIIF